MSPTEWYCPPVPSKSSTICSNCFSEHNLGWKGSSHAEKLFHFSLMLDGAPHSCNCPPSHYNSCSFCKFCFPTSLQIIFVNQITGPHIDLTVIWTQCPYYTSVPHNHLNATSLTLLATWVKRSYSMTIACDRKMSLCNKHLSCGLDLPVTLLQCTYHLSLDLGNTLQSLLPFWPLFSPVMTGLVALWNRLPV